MQQTALWFGLVAGVAALFLLPALRLRLELSKAKHPSLTGHARIARRVAALVPSYAYDEDDFLLRRGARGGSRTGGVPGSRAGGLYRQRFARGAALTTEAEAAISDCNSPAVIGSRSNTAGTCAST
jgi:glutamate-1-semialdehyde 2,1-aminomutase